VSIALNGEHKEDARVSLQDGSLLQPPLQDLSPFLPVEETPAVAVARHDVNLLLVQAQRNVRKHVLDGSISQETALVALSHRHDRSVLDTAVVADILRPTSLPFPVISVAHAQEPQPRSKPNLALADVPVASADANADEPLALRILKEYWGPNTTDRNRYAQRLFTILFADGSKTTLVGCCRRLV
jgi:hypothetical protein